ncbi:hypothetical protein C2G38_2226949 [Gigaspora rosea]|uniref:Uncharacterized protein n=1 Tax=Gigaspora rosea TaxID=44941 RepID=A0A397U1W4_9GLOM|nr:hypothetical protein C2G38_2226949 [Gigaspora rosea]
MLIVSEDSSIEGNEDAIVKYYSFNLDIEENIDPKEGNNKDNHANFDPKEGKKVYNKGNQDKRKSNNIGKSVAKENKISIVEESEDESEENVENSKLIEGKEESNKVEGSNEIEEIEDNEEEFGNNDDDEIEDNDDEIEDNYDKIGDNDDEFGDNDDEFGDNNNEFGDNDNEDKEEIVNKKRKIKELQTRFKSDITLTGNKLKAAKLYKKHLKTIMQQSSTSKIIQFDSSLINGALIPELPSNILTYTSLLTNSNNQQILMFSSLMSMCYKSLHKVEISSYNSELYRRIFLRFLYEFELAYCYMKDFVIKYTSRSKGMKSTTQINALITRRITLQQLLNIENTTSETFLVSARKLKTFTTAGPRLVELLKALNDNWVILDLVDYTTITWLADIKKDEWIELIHQITSNS